MMIGSVKELLQSLIVFCSTVADQVPARFVGHQSQPPFLGLMGLFGDGLVKSRSKSLYKAYAHCGIFIFGASYRGQHLKAGQL